MDVGTRNLIHSLVKAAFTAAFADAARHRAILLAEKDEDLRAKARAKLGPDTEVLFPSEAEPIRNRGAIRWVLPPLSRADMADMSEGKANNPFLACAFELLLAGRTVETMEFAYKARKPTAPSALYALCQAQEKKLASFGLKELGDLTTQERTADSRRRGADTQESLLEKRDAPEEASLVTERVVRQAHKRGIQVITAKPRAVVTPLAAETARDLGIRIFKQS